MIKKKISGQSLFELVVAIGVIGLILLSLVSLATISVRNASYSKNNAEASRLGQEVIEWLRRERDTSWTNFVSQSTTSITRCVLGPSWAETKTGVCTTPNDLISGIFLRQVDFLSSDTNGDTFADRIEVGVKIFWTDGLGYHEVKNSTYFSDWRLQ